MTNVEDEWEKEFDQRFSDIFGHGGEEAIKDFIRSLLVSQEKQIKKEYLEIIQEMEKQLHGGGNGRRLFSELKEFFKTL